MAEPGLRSELILICYFLHKREAAKQKISGNLCFYKHKSSLIAWLGFKDM